MTTLYHLVVECKDCTDVNNVFSQIEKYNGKVVRWEKTVVNDISNGDWVVEDVYVIEYEALFSLSDVIKINNMGGGKN